jgi:hypothetical protein
VEGRLGARSELWGSEIKYGEWETARKAGFYPGVLTASL